ncbi:MAG: hypothetical protein LBT57_01815 [Puniceicoccales bacterium]|jgi:sulfite reductase (NADPH) flavoprotein alpha-component|nr:hypothetical protein [Puniceicoccales bacterium]
MEAGIPYDRHHPFEATLLSRRSLCRGETEREAYHLVIDIRRSQWHYSCGDSLAILPQNDPRCVSDLLQRLCLEPLTLITLPSSGVPKPLRLVLEEELCLNHLPKSFWEFLRRRVAKDGELYRKIPVGESEGWENFLKNHTLAKALELFPDFRCTAQELVEHLRPMLPRLYSIASAPTLFPEEVHLAIVMVKYEDIYGEKRHGVATRYLSPEGIPVGGRCRCFLVRSHFRLPEDIRRDMILVGPGTGVAPFRGFIWEYAAQREAGKETGRTWLFFGSLRRHSHFYYQEEWEELMARGVLTHLDCAFSRDQAEKIYVQHRLLEHGPELARWILGGAHFYICGDASHMAKDVEAALLQILSVHAHLSDPGDYLRTMRREKRYQKDVY